MELGHINQSYERAVLVGLILPHQPENKLNEYLDELAFLANTAGADVIKVFKQNMKHPHRGTFIGSGKLKEIAEYVEANEIDLVIFDDDLSPSQQFNIEKEIHVKIIDRSYLILDIFATRARTAQAKAQVELAQMKYLLPRLRGMWEHLDRQKGGIGMRGTGEKEIETDRRIVNQRMTKLKENLAKIDRQNQTRRKTRGQLIRVALVGYTNVGKSTIMNVLSKSEVFAENKLFATLDTTVRKVTLERTPFLLSDTVGFIRKLPHSLVESFKSTLDELRESDILLHVVDVAHPQFEDHIVVVDKLLKEFNATELPCLTIFNKIDAFEAQHFDEMQLEEDREEIMKDLKTRISERIQGESIFISAIKKTNIQDMRARLLAMVQEQYKIRYPYRKEFY